MLQIRKKIQKNPSLRKLICWLIYFYIRFVYRTTFWTVQDYMEAKNTIASSPCMTLFWHGRLFIMPELCVRPELMDVLISTHNDGDIISRVMEHFKFGTIWGSSNRDSMKAARSVIKSLRSGRNVSITPDGPRGPRMRLNSNLVTIAEMTGKAIIPVTFSVCRGKVLRSWDRFLFPYPFNKGILIYGHIFHVPEQADQAARDLVTKQVEDELNRITREADIYCGREPVFPEEIATKDAA